MTLTLQWPGARSSGSGTRNCLCLRAPATVTLTVTLIHLHMAAIYSPVPLQLRPDSSHRDTERPSPGGGRRAGGDDRELEHDTFQVVSLSTLKYLDLMDLLGPRLGVLGDKKCLNIIYH